MTKLMIASPGTRANMQDHLPRFKMCLAEAGHPCDDIAIVPWPKNDFDWWAYRLPDELPNKVVWRAWRLCWPSEGTTICYECWANPRSDDVACEHGDEEEARWDDSASE